MANPVDGAGAPPILPAAAAGAPPRVRRAGAGIALPLRPGAGRFVLAPVAPPPDLPPTGAAAPAYGQQLEARRAAVVAEVERMLPADPRFAELWDRIEELGARLHR